MGYNPPGITIMIFSGFIIGACKNGCILVERINSVVMNKILYFLNKLGKHTLYIFLYHRLFLDYYLQTYLNDINIWAKRISFLIIMIFGSLLIEYIINTIETLIKKQKISIYELN